ncbi:MAG: glycosyltransferase family 39 protein [Deltaproteobacteria bacterium]|nr:glycosyltransferase family 39 protein [Deltaproteobacteria bacterium]
MLGNSSKLTQESGSSPIYASPYFPLAFLVVVKLALHLFLNGTGGYGLFRDELYYLACADHLAWGYVDHPPLSVFLLAAVRWVIGDSLFAIRLLPAFAGAALVLVTGLLARQLGGGRWAIFLAGLASLVAGANLALASFWSMNIFDLLLTAIAVLLLARLLASGERKYWVWLGIVLGLGLLNKVGVLWIGLGLAVSLICSRQRHWFAGPWPWVSGLLAGGLFLPYVLWNASHDWAHLEFIGEATTGKYSGLSAWTFLQGLVLGENPATLVIWMVGLGWLLLSREAQRYRPLGILWLTAFGVLLANGHSKAGYLAPAFVIVFAAGGVAWEGIARRSRPRFQRILIPTLTVLVASGAILAPFAVPLLPVETFIRYAAALGIEPGTDEGHELAELPQFYADMFGWEEKAAAVAEVFRALPEEERQMAGFFTSNYGRAGAIDYWSETYGLPKARSTHNNYWLWGPGDLSPEVVVVLGGEREDLERRFESVELAGTASCDYCIPYEDDLPIYVCRHLRLEVEELWAVAKHYD